MVAHHKEAANCFAASLIEPSEVLWTGMTPSIVSEICSRRRIIGPILLRAISVRADPRLAVGDRASDDSAGGQAAENSGAISIVAATIPPVSAVVAVTAMSPAAALMANAVMAILDRLRVRFDLA
jgi:hypothetical protein